MMLESKTLIEALNRLKPIAGGRTTLPILSCVKMHMERNRLHLTASDLDQYQVERIECDGEFEPCCVELQGLLNALGGETVSIKRVKDSIAVTCDFGVTNLDVLSANEFPPAPKCDGLEKYGVSGGDLANGINSVVWAASTDPSRYVLQSVHIVGASKMLRIESTNGRELAVFEQPLISSDFEALIPSQFASGFSDALTRKGAELGICDGHVKITHDSGAYFAKQVDGKYPNMLSVIPKKQDKIGLVPVGKLRDLIGRCNFYSDPSRTPSALLEFSANGIRVEFVGSAANLDHHCDGKFKSMTATVNANSFYKLLSAIKEDEAVLSCDGDKGVFPVLIIQSGNLLIYTTQVAPNFQSKPKQPA